MTSRQRSQAAASLALWITKDHPTAGEIQTCIEHALRDAAYQPRLPVLSDHPPPCANCAGPAHIMTIPGNALTITYIRCADCGMASPPCESLADALAVWCRRVAEEVVND